jgi:hypothetical protein
MKNALNNYLNDRKNLSNVLQIVFLTEWPNETGSMYCEAERGGRYFLPLTKMAKEFIWVNSGISAI